MTNFKSFRNNNTVKDENVIRKNMLASICKMRVRYIIENTVNSSKIARETVCNHILAFQEKYPTYIPAGMYNEVLQEVKQFSTRYIDDVRSKVIMDFVAEMSDSKITEAKMFQFNKVGNEALLDKKEYISLSESTRNVSEGYYEECMTMMSACVKDLWYDIYKK